MPSECPSCHEKSIDLFGQGTEQLEEEVSRLFPEAKVGRMDTDTTRGKNSYEKIIDDFENNRIQILVGTQMLSKGLDFGNVSVVGIISADSLLNYPDFRSYERGFQLMTQAAGRSGRKSKQGKVIIQSNDPDQSIYRYIVENDYESFFASQLSERKIFKYPPFYRLISIVIKDKNESKSDEASHYLADRLKSSLGDRVWGPNKPVIGKIQTYYIRNILLKTEIGLSPLKIRNLVKQAETILRDNQKFKYITLYYDVDPA
jgi:primosomal protein N' (replication factor Y)